MFVFGSWRSFMTGEGKAIRKSSEGTTFGPTWAQSDGLGCRQIKYFRWLSHVPVIQLCKQLRVFCILIRQVDMFGRTLLWNVKNLDLMDKGRQRNRQNKLCHWSYHGSQDKDWCSYLQVSQVFMEKVEGASKLYFEAWKFFVIPKQKSLQRFVRVDFGVKQPKRSWNMNTSSGSEGFVGSDTSWNRG